MVTQINCSLSFIYSNTGTCVKADAGCVCWLMDINPALGRLRQGWEFKAILAYKARSVWASLGYLIQSYYGKENKQDPERQTESKTERKKQKTKISRYLGLFGIKIFHSLVSCALIFGLLFGFEFKFWFNFGSL